MRRAAVGGAARRTRWSALVGSTWPSVGRYAAASTSSTSSEREELERRARRRRSRSARRRVSAIPRDVLELVEPVARRARGGRCRSLVEVDRLAGLGLELRVAARRERAASASGCSRLHCVQRPAACQVEPLVSSCCLEQRDVVPAEPRQVVERARRRRSRRRRRRRALGRSRARSRRAPRTTSRKRASRPAHDRDRLVGSPRSSAATASRDTRSRRRRSTRVPEVQDRGRSAGPTSRAPARTRRSRSPRRRPVHRRGSPRARDQVAVGAHARRASRAPARIVAITPPARGAGPRARRRRTISASITLEHVRAPSGA